MIGLSRLKDQACAVSHSLERTVRDYPDLPARAFVASTQITSEAQAKSIPSNLATSREGDMPVATIADLLARS